MFFYLVTFAATLLFFYFACKFKNNSIEQWIFSILSISVASFLAGVRDYTIGTDTLFYAYDVFYDACASMSYNLFDPRYLERFEPGYLLLNFIVGRCSSDLHVMLFVMMFIQMLFMVKGLLYYKDKMPVIWGLAAFLFMYYNVSLNIARQMMAAAIIFYSYRFVLEKRLVPFVACIVLAFMFHRSAFIFFVAYPLQIYFERKQDVKSVVLMVVFLILGMIIIQQTISSVLNVIGLDSKYGYYFRYASHGFFLTKLLLGIPLFLLFLMYSKRIFCDADKEDYYLLFCLLVSVLSTQAREWIGESAERLVLYFSFFQILALPRVLYFTIPSRFFVMRIYMGYWFVYWYYNFIYNGFQATYPYTSDVLKHLF